MHPARLFISIFFSLCLSEFMLAQPAWRAQSSPVQADLVTVSFPTTTSGWAVTDTGTVIHTTNGGKNWSIQTDISGFYAEKVLFQDTLKGWLVGNNVDNTTTDRALILKTEDGGETWNTNLSQDISKLYDIFFVNDTMGWAVGYYLPDGDTVGLRLHTIDAGALWTVQDIGISVATIYSSIHFRDTEIGDLCGPGPVLMHTNTGGRTSPGWALDIKQITQPVYDMVNAGDVYGCMVGAEGKIIFTKDRWTNFFLDYDYESGDTLWSVDATESLTFWTVGEAGTIIYAGINPVIGPVVQDQSLDIPQNLYEVDAIDPLNAWAVGQSGIILHYSMDSGSGIQDPSKPFFSIFPNPASDYIILNRTSTDREFINIYDQKGILVRSMEARKGDIIISVPLRDLQSGIYILQMGMQRKLLMVSH